MNISNDINLVITCFCRVVKIKSKIIIILFYRSEFLKMLIRIQLKDSHLI